MQMKISVVSNMWVKQMTFEHSGDIMEGHKHTFDHQTLLSVGIFKVCVEGVCSEYADTILFIEKGKEHSIECVSESGLAYCLHPLRDGEKVEDIVDPADMPLFGGSLKNTTALVE